MNRELLAKTLALVRDLPPGQVCELTVEQAGLLGAFLERRAKDPAITDAERSLHERIRTVLKAWHSRKPSAPANAEAGADKRTQLALRGAIDKVMENQWADLSEDEERLIRATHSAVAQRQAANADEPDRLFTLLTAMVGKLDARQSPGDSSGSKTKDSASLFDESIDHSVTTSSNAKTVSAESLFSGGHRNPVSSIDGIDVDLSLRRIVLDRSTVVDGDVPNDILLIVKGGDLEVNGFVAGNIVADGNVVVNGNVQGGIIVSRKGDIQVNRALVKSVLVSKRGNIVCSHLEDPTCVFAWGSILVAGQMMGGKIYAAHVKVTGRMLSGEIHSCGDIHANAIESNRRTPPVICLRKKLTCRDYGRKMDETVFSYQRRVGQLETEIDTLSKANEHTYRLVHHCYRTALLYLVGGVENADTLRRLQGLQTKSIHLRQIIAVAERVHVHYSSLLEEGAAPSESDDHFKRDSLAALKIISDAVAQLPDELGAPCRTYLLERCRQFRTMLESLDRSYQGTQKNGHAGLVFVDALEGWTVAMKAAEDEAEKLMSELDVDPALLERLDANPDGLEEMLEQTLQSANSDTPEEMLARFSSALIPVLKDQANRYKKSIQSSETKREAALAELKKYRGRLADDAAVLFGGTNGNDCSVVATFYDSGTVLTTSPDKTSGSDGKAGEVIVLHDAIEGATRFRLRDRVIQRV